MNAESERSRTLHEGWSLWLDHPGPGAPPGSAGLMVPASVPGCVHTDLTAAGRMADPDVGLAAEEQQWVGRSVWRYATEFSWAGASDPRVDLVFGGLDTVAAVRLNGELLGRTQNMHRSYRFSASELLRVGRNHLEVTFSNVYDLVDAVRAEVGELPSPAPGPQGYVRKMGANFGTDWLPPLTTAGIWRPVVLESWSDARIGSVRPLVHVAERDTARVEVHIDVETERPGAYEVDVRLGDTTVTAPVVDGRALAVVAVEQPRLWWPIGLGEPYRYPLAVQLREGTRVVDGHRQLVGLRRVEVVEEPDAVGRRWALHVNGRQVRIRGFDWICDDPFPAQVTPERYRRRVDQAVGTHANLLRVWGGATYESEVFYDICDELGVLVWQDFMFSAAAYPETQTFANEVEAEVREVVGRLAGHPSVVIWSGGNECLWGWHDWGWQTVLQGRPWGAGYYFDLLPRVLAELDPTAPYVPGTPWSEGLAHPPNDPAYGVTHLWDVWNTLDYEHYRDDAPSFVPELGWCGPPAWTTLRRAAPDGDLWPDNPVVAYHLRADDGLAKLARGLADHFLPVSRPEDWHFLASVLQARAMTVAVDHLRGLDRCAGVVLWQLQDCWPVISWSMIDDDDRLLPVWYAVRAAFAPHRGTVQPVGPHAGEDELDLVLVNDDPNPWTAAVRLRRVGLDGTVYASEDLSPTIDPDAVRRLRLDLALTRPHDPRCEVLVADVDGCRTTWFWRVDRDLTYPPARYTVSTRTVADGLAATVRAETFLRDLVIFPDRLTLDGEPLGPDAVVDDVLVTLLPGEEHTFLIRGADGRHASAVTGPPVLRCLNDRKASDHQQI